MLFLVDRFNLLRQENAFALRKVLRLHNENHFLSPLLVLES